MTSVTGPILGSPKPLSDTNHTLPTVQTKAIPMAPSLTTSPTNTSGHTSPDGPTGRSFSTSHTPSPLHLPDSSFKPPRSPSIGAMSEIQLHHKTSGLMRRLSMKGARERIIGRRSSSNNMANRAHSSGPVIMRRRSGSKTTSELDFDTLDLESAREDDEEDDELHTLLSPMSPPLLTNGSTLAKSSKKASRSDICNAPIIPDELRRGTMITKVTRKKRKTLLLRLDPLSAKVYWNPSNQTKRFYIDDIHQIRTQADAQNYREEFGVSAQYEKEWVTIIYADQDRSKGRTMKTMHLIAFDQPSYELWTTTLKQIIKYRHELMAGLAGSDQDERTLRAHWDREMSKVFGEGPRNKDDEKLDLAGLENLCQTLHITCTRNVLRLKFEMADVNRTGHLTFAEFKDFVRMIKERDDLKDIYRKLLEQSPRGLLTEDSFLFFLKHIQGIDVDANVDQWKKIFSSFVTRADMKAGRTQEASETTPLNMSFEAFSNFLSSTANGVLAPMTHPEITKFDRPLNEYFISSSHNTYLLGRQIAGSSSTEAYIRALQRGCRCVEIDCWDGSDGKPIVLHGRTMTSSVLFADCISVIAKYAFTASSYPLIISLEVHCNAVQQQAMVDIMIRGFGDKLLREPLQPNNLVLPSPDELRNKILIKVKASHSSISVDAPAEMPSTRRQRSASSPWQRPQILDNGGIPPMPGLSSPSSMSPMIGRSTWSIIQPTGTAATTSISSTTDEESDVPQTLISPTTKSTKTYKSKIVKNLGDLGVYAKGIKYKDFTLPESRTYNHIYSLSERTFEAQCRDVDTKYMLEKHNMRHLMRVYPSGYRLKSTNFDPLVFWRRGVQMAALNWQTYDLGMQINEAMFASGSDHHGYVLKPRDLRTVARTAEDSTLPPSPLGPRKPPKKLLTFSVEMISAQQLPRPRGYSMDYLPNPYVEIEIFCAEDKSKSVASGEGGKDSSARKGFSGIGAPHRRQTSIVVSNGYNPIFNETFSMTVATKYPDLVFVRWNVWNSPDGRNPLSSNNPANEPLATFTAKLSTLQQGYRHLPLFDHNGDQYLFTTLFVKIAKQNAVTLEREQNVFAAAASNEAAEIKGNVAGRFRGLGQAAGGFIKRTLSVERRKKDERAMGRSDSTSTLISRPGSLKEGIREGAK